MSSFDGSPRGHLVAAMPMLLAYVRRRVGDLEMVEDIVQEVGLRALRGVAPDDPLSFRLWLCGIARHVICAEWRRRRRLRRKQPPADFLFDDVPDPLGFPDRVLDARASLTHAIGPEVEHLSILFRRYVDNESSEALAKELGITTAALRMRLVRIRERVRTRSRRTA